MNYEKLQNKKEFGISEPVLACWSILLVPLVFADDMGVFYGNLPKLFLGVASAVFDVIMLFQHHVLYRGHESYDALDDEDKNQAKSDRKDKDLTKRGKSR